MEQANPSLSPMSSLLSGYMPSEDSSHVSSSSSSQAPPERQPAPSGRSRRVKRSIEKPQLQWVTATNPDEFKNASSRKHVRSHVMLQYFHEQMQQNRSSANFRPLRSKGKQNQRPTDAIQSPPQDLDSSYESLIPSPSAGSAISRSPKIAPPTFVTDSEDSSSSGLDLVPTFKPNPYASQFLFARAYGLDDDEDDADNLSLEEGKRNNRLSVEMYISIKRYMKLMLFTGRSDIDAFFATPQYQDARLDVMKMVRVCCSAFVKSENMSKIWIPMMLQNPVSFLSATCISSVYQDVMDGYVGDSLRTSLAKGESLCLINERVKNAQTQADDWTIMSICQIVAADVISSDERTLEFHEKGMEMMVQQRGGLYTLGVSGQLSFIMVSIIFNVNMFKETQPKPMFLNFVPLKTTPSKGIKDCPESPLYAPRGRFTSKSPLCSKSTLDLLCSMRELTALVIDSGVNVRRGDREKSATRTFLASIIEEDLDLESVRVRQIASYKLKLQAIYYRVLALPSAYDASTPVYHDWIYESCRLASLIYSYAINYGVPFSIAASATSLLESQKQAARVERDGMLGLDDIPEYFIPVALHAAINRTPYNDSWNDLMGVFFWVSVIGAAASRSLAGPAQAKIGAGPLAGDNGNAERVYNSHNHVGGRWTRKCMLLFAQRASILIGFEHPAAIIGAQRRMLKIQEMCGSTAAAPT